jgi:hypothetical protein
MCTTQQDFRELFALFFHLDKIIANAKMGW